SVLGSARPPKKPPQRASTFLRVRGRISSATLVPGLRSWRSVHQESVSRKRRIEVLAHDGAIPVYRERKRLDRPREIHALEAGFVQQEGVENIREVVPRDHIRLIDSPCNCETGTGKINGVEALLVQRKTLPGSRREANADNLARTIDSERLGAGGGARKVNGLKTAFAREKEPMAKSTGSEVEPDDVAGFVDPERLRAERARKVDRGKVPCVKQEA